VKLVCEPPLPGTRPMLGPNEISEVVNSDQLPRTHASKGDQLPKQFRVPTEMRHHSPTSLVQR